MSAWKRFVPRQLRALKINGVMPDFYEVSQGDHRSCHILRNGWEDVTAWARKTRFVAGAGQFDVQEMLSRARAVAAYLNGDKETTLNSRDGLARIGKSRLRVDAPTPGSWASSAHIYDSSGALMFTVWARRADRRSDISRGGAAAAPGMYDQAELFARARDIAAYLNSTLAISKQAVVEDAGSG